MQKSFDSVASGLHVWPAFATDILGYSEDETLPPKQDVDICKFLAIFKNPGTATNYVGYIKFASTHLTMVTSWWSPTVTLTLKGLRVEHLRTNGGPSITKVLRTDEWVAQLARLSEVMRTVCKHRLFRVHQALWRILEYSFTWATVHLSRKRGPVPTRYPERRDGQRPDRLRNGADAVFKNFRLQESELHGLSDQLDWAECQCRKCSLGDEEKW